MRVLVLDDDDNRHGRFREWLIGTIATHVHTATEAIAALRDGERFDLVCLDHDLDLCTDATWRETGDGADVSRFIGQHLDRAKMPRAILIHSWNPAGARNMAADLQFVDSIVYRMEFGNSTGMILAGIGRRLKELAEQK